MPTHPQLLQEFIELVVEARKMREVDVSDGSRVPHGSRKHVKDLEARIAGLIHFRDKHKKGSEARANYSRLIGKLKGELGSAKRAGGKGKLKEAEGDKEPAMKWWQDPKLNDIDSPTFMNHVEKWQKMADEPEFKPFIDAVRAATHPKELAKAKRAFLKADDAGETHGIPIGMWMHFYNQRKQQLHDMNDKPSSSADARMDRLLRIRDSSGKATPRKF